MEGKKDNDGKVVTECPTCHDIVEFDFTEFLNKAKLSSKTDTQLVKYPCPKCGIYFEPAKHVGGYAYCDCPNHGLFKTSKAVSLNFRKFCSKLGAAPNRNPGYYTSEEKKVQKYLLKVGEIEGLSFFHNARICTIVNKVKKRYYWLDFMMPRIPLVIECNPEIWHRMWNRDEADQRKKDILDKLRVILVELSDEDVRKIDFRKKVWCEKLDIFFRMNEK